MKKILFSASAVLAGLPLLAADGDKIVDVTAVNSLMGQIKTDLSGWVSAALPVLGGIAGCFLLFWLVKVVFRVIKGWSNKAG